MEPTEPPLDPPLKHIPLPTALAPISHAQIQPGLGLSETWYSWIISLSSLGEFTGAITYGVLLRFFLTKHLMLVNLSVAATGGLFYGIGKFGWMLLIGKYGHKEGEQRYQCIHEIADAWEWA